MKIALTQFAASDNPSENLEKQASMVEEAAKSGAKIVCTQELFKSKYFCIGLDPENFNLAEGVSGDSVKALSKIAADFDVAVVASIFEKRCAGVYHNTAVIIDAGGSVAGVYRKMHIPHDPHFEEKYYFTPGDTGYRAWNTKYGKIGVLVCWDQWYPEAARLTALAGAEIIFYPTAIGGLSGESESEVADFRSAWRTVQCGHAVANGLFVAAANRVGTESGSGDSIKFWGGSFFANPYGRVVAEASGDSDEILIADIDFSEAEKFRRTWPFFRDRRIDSYGEICKRFGY